MCNQLSLKEKFLTKKLAFRKNEIFESCYIYIYMDFYSKNQFIKSWFRNIDVSNDDSLN
jgi:hypothetical protein